MNSKAIYTVIDDEGAYEFATDIAGGFCYPFYVLSSGRLTARELGENGMISEVQPHEVLPLMRANYKFPKEFRGKKIFSALSGEQADKLRIDFIEKADIPFHITLDFQKREVGFEFNKNIRDDELCDLRVSADDKLIVDAGYNGYTKHLLLDEANESYRLAIAELCRKMVIKSSPIFSVEFETPKGKIEVSMPASEAEMNSLKVFAGITDIDTFDTKIKSVSHENLECLKGIHCPKLTVLNEIAQALRNGLGTEETPYETFAAVMEADNIINAKNALFIAQNIDAFECIHVSNDEEYGHYVLYESERDDVAKCFSEYVEDYIDYDMFGYDRAQDDGAISTSKGYVLRDEEKIAQRMSPQTCEQSL